MAYPESETRSSGGLRVAAFTVLALILAVAALVWWFRTSESAPRLDWMAWTVPTAIFFATIATLLVAMTVWEAIRPGGGPRVGILRFETTRGDRLFLSLLGAAFIHLGWLALVGGPSLWPALGISLGWALLVFLLV